MFSTASFRKTLNFACQLAVQLPFGQYVNWMEVLTSVRLVAEITGKSHCSYCTEPERLYFECSTKLEVTPASVAVPPSGIYCLLTF